MPLTTEIEARGIQETKRQLIDFFHAFREGKEDVKKLNKEMRQIAQPIYGMRRSLTLIRTEWKTQHATLVETARLFRDVSSIGRSLTSMFRTYTVGQIRVERAQRDAADAAKTVAELQDRYNRYLEVFCKDSVFTKRALEDLTEAKQAEKEATDLAAQAQNDMRLAYIGIALEAPTIISSFIDIGEHVKTLTALIKDKGGLIAALKELKGIGKIAIPITLTVSVLWVQEEAEKLLYGKEGIATEKLMSKMTPEQRALYGRVPESERWKFGLAKTLENLWNSITSFFGGLAGGEQLGGFVKGGGQFGIPYVPETGLYMLHKGEKVTRTTERIEKTTPKLINIRNTIHIGSVSSETDIEELSKRISEKTIEKLGEKW